MERAGPSAAVEALLARRPREAGGAGATWAQTMGNVLVSIMGTGVLGLPFAFLTTGWLAGALGVTAASLSSYYCMLLLVQCRNKLDEDPYKSSPIHNYGDLGAKAFGRLGRYLTELLIIIAQAGGAIAQLVFISQNLSSLFAAENNEHQISPTVFIFLILLPLEIGLSFIRSLSAIAPFSVFAAACNVLAMAIVFKEDFLHFGDFFGSRSAFNGPWGLPFAGGVAVFCFEGFSMTLSLEASMADRGGFRWVLSRAFLGLTLAYVCFGVFGYLAYGEETRDIITLNLPNNWSAAAVKVGLCTALAFTFPIMVHSIHEILEAKLQSIGWFQNLCYKVRGAEWLGLHGIRVFTVAVLAILASLVPGFGEVISFVGSTVCALLSFVLPATFHLIFVGSSLSSWQRTVDCAILLTGIMFAGYATYAALSGRSFGS